MKVLFGFMSIMGLLLTVLPAVFVFSGGLAWEIHSKLMFLGMILWFVFAPFWMRKRRDGVSE